MSARTGYSWCSNGQGAGRGHPVERGLLGGQDAADSRCFLHTAYRTNTFPLVHLNFFHALMNVLALTPLLERFESEYGTLTSLALFFGRECCPLCPA